MKRFLSDILKGPQDLFREFVCGAVTFGELYTLAGVLYYRFLEIEDKSIPVCLATEERDLVAAAILAAMASGVTLVLPHSLSRGALLQMHEVTGFSIAVTDGRHGFPEGTRILSSALREDETKLPEISVNPNAELLQLFTGGSTGTPKIWSKTSANLFGEALFMAGEYGIDRNDVIVATVTPYHIYGLLFSVLIPLVATAAVAPETPSFPAEIAGAVARHTATVLVSVPVHYRALADRQLSPTLRLAFSSAGMLEEGDNELFCRSNDMGIVEVYGSTETGGLATRNRGEGQTVFYPLSPVSWKIIRRRFWVSSPFLSPDLPRDEDGFFLSGDLVEQHGENSFSLQGRADSVTKVGGERVDLDEVREVIRNQAGVKECVVIVHGEDTSRGNRIDAVVRGENLDIGALRSVLAGILEPAARPKRILAVKQIPVTANGKYDRHKIFRLLNGFSS